MLASKYKDLRILSDTRSEKDTLAVFGGQYPGGALYTKAEWIASHEKEVQAMTNAIVVHAEVDPLAFGRGNHRQDAAGVHQEQGSIYLGAEEHDGDVFRHRPHGPEGRAKPCSPCSASPRRR